MHEVQREPSRSERPQTVTKAPAPLAVERLQRTAGNQAVGRMLTARRAELQRRVTYVNGGEHHVEKIERGIEKLVREEGVAPLENELGHGLVAMRASPIDYGLFDLDDPQHLMLLYHQLKRQTRAHVPREGEAADAPTKKQEEAAATDDKSWREYVVKAGVRNVVKTAYVGAGAAIAYEVAVRSANEPPGDALIIGPWEPWSGTRGPGVVAHPKHMISPMLQFTGAADMEIDDTWLERGKFAALVQKVFTKSLIPQLRRGVTAIDRKEIGGRRLYEIMVEGSTDPIYASTLVFGAGVGGHQAPRGATVAKGEGELDAHRVVDMDLFTRVADRLEKDSDGTLRIGEAGKAKTDIKIVLSGGNGAIDVAFDALGKGYKVEWIVGRGGPQFLPGFFNYAAYLAYLRTLATEKPPKNLPKGVTDVEKEIERVNALLPKLYEHQELTIKQAAKKLQDEAGLKFDAIHFGRMGKIERDGKRVVGNAEGPPPARAVGDLLVYGQGQDNATFKLLDKFLLELMPEWDSAGAFGAGGGVKGPSAAAVGLHNADDSLRVVGATAYRLAPQVAPNATWLEPQIAPLEVAFGELAPFETRDRPFYTQAGQMLALFKDELAAAREDEVADKNQETPKPSARKADAVVAVLTALGRDHYDRERDAARAKEPEKAYADAITKFDGLLAKARSQAQGRMQPVIGALPPNVLLNDQLTSTRGEAAAANEFLPYDTARNVDFATADRNALAVHIAARYPELLDVKEAVATRTADAPAAEGTGWTLGQVVSTIVSSRRKEGVLDPVAQAAPASVPPYDKEFQKYWTDWLASKPWA